ncbi:MAG: SDR family NAD(P)-dependent oxidoreductase [Anaerolineae bacterium]|nr:SDR family NAD(P)-dependent oxidoreductase [Anaerolineae bacterium]
MVSEALIWGASGGIGQALVHTLKEAGWRVHAAARHTDQIPAAADTVCEFDAASEASIQQAVMQVAQQSGRIDLMVYAAGTLVYDKVETLPLAGWQATLDSNLTGAYLAARHSLALLPEGGHMVFIGAYVEHLRILKMSAYAAAKAALAELVQVLAKEHRRQRFTLVRPGPVNTPFWRNVTFKMPAEAKAPAVVAAAILQHHLAGAAGALDL